MPAVRNLEKHDLYLLSGQTRNNEKISVEEVKYIKHSRSVIVFFLCHGLAYQTITEGFHSKQAYVHVAF